MHCELHHWIKVYVIQVFMLPLCVDLHVRSFWLDMTLACCFILFVWNNDWLMSWSRTWSIFKICCKTCINVKGMNDVNCDFGIIFISNRSTISLWPSFLYLRASTTWKCELEFWIALSISRLYLMDLSTFFLICVQFLFLKILK